MCAHSVQRAGREISQDSIAYERQASSSIEKKSTSYVALVKRKETRGIADVEQLIDEDSK